MSPSSRSSSRVPGGSPAPDDFLAADRGRSGEALTRLDSRLIWVHRSVDDAWRSSGRGRRITSLTWTSDEER